jgi:signal transduction histidine kinase
MGTHGAAATRLRALPSTRKSTGSADVTPGHKRQLRNLTDWPVARRLFAVILAALLMGLVFGGLRVAAAESSASQFNRTEQLAKLGNQLLPVVDDLQNERDATAIALSAEDDVRLAKLYAKTDSDLVPVRSALQRVLNAGGYPASTAFAVAAVNNALSSASIAQLHNLFNTATGDVVSPSYGSVIGDIITLQGQVSLGVTDQALNSDVQTLTALSQAKDTTAQLQTALDQSLATKTTANGFGFLAVATVTSMQVTYAEEFNQEAAFQTTATSAESGMYDSLLGPQLAKLKAEDMSDNIEQALFAVAGGQPTVANTNILSSNGISYPLFIADQQLDGLNTPQHDGISSNAKLMAAWDNGNNSKLAAMQATQQFVAANITTRATQLLQAAQRSALAYLVITVVVLLLVLAAALLVARSLVLPLRQLRAGALDVASVQLPERVRLLSEDPESASTTDVTPINVTSQDEIGQVARAFDRVHSEAVRLAGEQAALRTNFNAMFVNLSRRSQTLIERLARMIDNLEQNEDDPDRLGSLFSMDHLVTRMRRNSENLLLLAGHDNPRKWSDAVPLADVARAATSEIEQYNRVVLSVPTGVALSGQSVSDVVHLLAELIENATTFSSKDTQVLVALQELASGGVLIEVIDKGIGVSESRLAEMNWRLDHPPTMDVSVSRHMGLFAVARLAERHRIRIRLRPARQQGLSALVWLPDGLLERTGKFSATSNWSAQSAGARSDVAMAGALAGAATAVAIPPAPIRQAGTPDVGDGSGYGGPADRTPSGWFRGGAVGARPSFPDFGTGQGEANPRDSWLERQGARGPAERPSWPGQDNQTVGGLPVRTPRSSQNGPAEPAPAPGPGQDSQTVGGLPVRTPRARFTDGNGTPNGPAGGSSAGKPNGQQSGAGKALPQRSPEQARSRLAGFQRGTRRAEGQGGSDGQAPSAGEGTLS